jgi:hypothetical protein
MTTGAPLRRMIMEKGNIRTIASLFMLYSFIVLVPSGIALHVTADDGPGIANHIAMTLHNVSAAVFLISGIVHIVLNRSSILSALRSKTGPYPVMSGRSALIAIIFIVLLAGALAHVFILG